MSDYTNTPRALGWDDEISSDSGFFLLEEGDYNFTITVFERGRFPGGAKISPCDKAILTLTVEAEGRTADVKYDLILWSTLDWKIADVFCAVGLATRAQAKRGFQPPWKQLVGSKGRARFRPREYTKKDGSTGYANDVDKFYDYDPAVLAAASAPKQTSLPGMKDPVTGGPWGAVPF